LDRLNCTHAECLPPETAARRGQGRRRGGGQPNLDRRVYVSIKPDARGINLGKGMTESAARDRSIALIETAAYDLNAGLPLLAANTRVCVT